MTTPEYRVLESLRATLRAALSGLLAPTMAFESAVEAALAATQRVLGANRKLALPADVHRE